MKNIAIISFSLFLTEIFAYSKSHLFICNQYTCPAISGKCGRDNECICAFGYTTIESEKFGDFKCNYKMKSQIKMFLLEFLVGFGVGHFYIGNIKIALAKLLYSSLTCYIVCQLPSLEKLQTCRHCAYYLQLVFGIGWILWQILDSILIGFGFYKDNYGVELRKW